MDTEDILLILTIAHLSRDPREKNGEDSEIQSSEGFLVAQAVSDREFQRRKRNVNNIYIYII